MTSRPVIVHLIGYPGAGKYTVARHIARLAADDGRRYVVLDNHHTSNVIFAVLDVDGVRPIAKEVWDRVGDVREVLYRTIADMSPREWSFVFTNVLTAGEPTDEAIVRRIAELAVARQCPYVPVRLVCARDEILRRVTNADRHERLKWIDPEAVGAFIDEHQLIEVDGHPPLQVDVTARPPDDTARLILAHIDSLD